MLKSCSGSALHYWVPEGLKTGRMVNRVGTDFMRCAHSQLHGHKKSIDELQAVNKALQIKLDDFLESLQAETGLCSSYRLVASVYFANHRPAFRSSASISELYNTIELGDGLESHTALVKIIREHMWERIQSEDNMLPNSDALQLHWDRSCWVA
ncbi:unnamed protein product [Mytilus edulis]|uniref:Uncharacterized protein n=1 Tax=Mytilus edulis TaxID=6550 RepID=A0A8S3PWX5_MYTED|nr:unnamed protein product [Mytilus edulis]